MSSFFQNIRDKQERFTEKVTSYIGKSMQTIGQIPIDAEVKLRLNPDLQVLVIKWKKKEITLPYNRIKDFNYSDTMEDITSKGARTAKAVLSHGPLAGRVIGSMISTETKFTTYATLEYVDKNGNSSALNFYNTEEIEHDAFDRLDDVMDGTDESDDHSDYDVKRFQEVIRRIVAKNSPDITEL